MKEATAEVMSGSVLLAVTAAKSGIAACPSLRARAACQRAVAEASVKAVWQHPHSICVTERSWEVRGQRRVIREVSLHALLQREAINGSLGRQGVELLHAA